MKIKITPRIYQEKIFATAAKQNTLVILPTGLGKTIIALMLAVHRLTKFPNSKILFLAPTKPLCEQHKKTFEENIDKGTFTVLTGTKKPEERKKLWESSDFIFATPQTITNDLISGRISFENVSLIIFDEAHRAVGDYDYVFLAKSYMKLAKNPHILALTASPGSDKEKINEIKRNLFIEKIEFRNEKSPEVKPYIKKMDIEKIFIDLPESLKELKELFEKALRTRLKLLKEANIIQTSDINKVKKSDMLKLQGKLVSMQEPAFFNYVSIVAACTKIMHCLELLQAQGIKPLCKFLEKLKRQQLKIKATKQLMKDTEFREAMARAFELEEKKVEHPKFEVLMNLINPKEKTIVFTNYRDTVNRIVEFLKTNPKLKPVKFIGQKSGMSQKEQIKTLNDFKEGKHNVLVSSSIGEEGLDIPEVQKVIFFEPIPSALRTIQRRGRTARHAPGKVIMLITKDTIDEKYYWVSFHKERKMKNALKELADEKNENNQKRITEF
jgi:ERCC4-related helicase